MTSGEEDKRRERDILDFNYVWLLFVYFFIREKDVQI